MFKLKIEKLEDVEEAHRAFYVEDKEAGGFVLAVEGLEDTGALKRAKEHEVEARKKAEAQVKKLEDERKAADEKARKAAEDAARASGDVAALEKSWQKKFDEALAAKDAEFKPVIEKQTSFIRRLNVDNVAQGIAAKIAVPGHSEALLPHILKRLDTEERDGEFITVIRDAQGKPSALTLEELTKEISASTVLAPLIQGSKASGGGAGGAKGGGATNDKQMKRADYEALDPVKKAEFMKGGGSLTDT